MSAFTSLESTRETGPGADRQLQKATAHHTLIVSLEGAPSAVMVKLEGSHDGFRWTQIGVFQSSTSGMLTTQANGALVTYVRANLVLIQGDDTARVSASIASNDA